MIEVKLPEETKEKEDEKQIDNASKDNPFERASKEQRRLKLFLWGDTGVGKTTLALQFPSPVVIDMEGGTKLYGESFDFDVRHTTSADEVLKLVDWLLTCEHNYRTLVIDPITIYWEALQKKWSDIFIKRNKKSAGFKFEFYNLQATDWMVIKQEFKHFVRMLIDLDMNVIITAREKTKYKDGSYLQSIGETFDGEKSLPYLFDTIVRMYTKKNQHMGFCIKDRTNCLPKEEFEISYNKLLSYFNKKLLEKKSTPVEYVNDRQKAELIELIKILDISEDRFNARLANYDADSIHMLKKSDAEIIINKLKNHLETKRGE